MSGTRKKTITLIKAIKKEPTDEVVIDKFETFTLDATSYVTSMNGDDVVTMTLDTLKTPVSKHTSSPAQEATRAKIQNCNVQLNRLYKLKTIGKLDVKGMMQIRAVEDERRKAQSKLKRLLNEAERQRRRRERIRRASAAKVLLTKKEEQDEEEERAFHNYSNSAAATSFVVGDDGGGGCADGIGPSENALVPRVQDDVELMSSLRHCAKFEDFLKEINTMGFALTKVNGDQHEGAYEVCEVTENGSNDGEVKVQVELIEGDGVLDQNMTVIEPDIQIVKQEPLSQPASPQPANDIQEARTKDAAERKKGPEPSRKRPTPSSNNNNMAKAIADEYARKHARFMTEWQEQYQEWFQKQVEAQQQWEETFMQEQIEVAKSTLETIGNSFLHTMQQILQNMASNARHRTLTPFVPSFSSSRNVEMNGLGGTEFSVFLGSDGASTSGPTVLSARTMADESFNSLTSGPIIM